MPPLVSIIMPAFNASKYIDESIISVLKQSVNNWELIVCDDHSSDDTFNIVDSYSKKDPRILLIKNNSGVSGASNARNCALKIAKGRYIAFLDSDDLWFQDKLELQLDIMSRTNYPISHTDYLRIDENGKEIKKVNCLGIVNYREQLKSNRIPNLTGIYDRSILGLFFQDSVGHEDYSMWLDILYESDSIGINKPLASYRVLSRSLSSNKFRAALWHYNIIKRQPSISWAKKQYLFFCYISKAIAKRL